MILSTSSSDVQYSLAHIINALGPPGIVKPAHHDRRKAETADQQHSSDTAA